MISTTNGGSFKLTLSTGRYTIDLYVRFKGSISAATVAFDTRVNSSSNINKIQVMEVLDNSGTAVKNIMPSGVSEIATTASFNTITSKTIDHTEGWIHLQYYANSATSSDCIYIDNFCIGSQQ